MTAMMLLIANTMHRPDHSHYLLDSQLIDVGMKTVDRMADGSRNDALEAFRVTFVELRRDAWHRHRAAATIVNSSDFHKELMIGERGLGTSA